MFSDAFGERHFIRLGKVDMKMADSVKTYAEKLVAAQSMSVSLDAETASWLAKLSDEFYSKLAKTGIVTPRKKVGTLSELIPAIIECRAATGIH